MLIKIISGGQTGADMGGLRAGRALNIPTGGSAPHGWKTELGPKKHLLKSFNLVECQSTGYPPRTAANVLNSTGTIVFGLMGGRGSALTERLCLKYKKPCHLQRFDRSNKDDERLRPEDIKDFQCWLIFHKILILNVAGNRESTNRGIEKFSKAFLIKVLEKEYSNET